MMKIVFALKKNIYMVITVLLFIVLLFVSFNLPANSPENNQNAYYSKNPNSVVNESSDQNSTQKKQDDTSSDTTDVNQSEINHNGVMANNVHRIQDLNAQYNGSQINIRWTPSSLLVDDEVTLYKYSTVPKSAVEKIKLQVSNGFYEDTKLTSGGTYYYMIEESLPKGPVVSSVASVSIPDIIRLSFGQPILNLNGNIVVYDSIQQKGLYKNGNEVMISVKALVDVFEAVQDDVYVDGKKIENALRIRYQDTEVQIFENQKQVIVNEKPEQMGMEAVIKQGRFYVPSEFFRRYWGISIVEDSYGIKIEKTTPRQVQGTENMYVRNVEMKNEQTFTIPLPVKSRENERWVYYVVDEASVKWQDTRMIETKDPQTLQEFQFQAKQPGNVQMVFTKLTTQQSDKKELEKRVYNVLVK